MLLPTITKIVNMSLSTATMVKSLKAAIVSPRLKKSHADYNQFSIIFELSIKSIPYL